MCNRRIRSRRSGACLTVGERQHIGPSRGNCKRAFLSQYTVKKDRFSSSTALFGLGRRHSCSCSGPGNGREMIGADGRTVYRHVCLSGTIAAREGSAAFPNCLALSPKSDPHQNAIGDAEKPFGSELSFGSWRSFQPQSGAVQPPRSKRKPYNPLPKAVENCALSRSLLND